MAQFLKNTICPRCRENGNDKAGDNLASYADGSGYCWSCGYYVHSDKASARLHTNRAKPVPNGNRLLELPEDCSLEYPSYVIDWVGKYDLTERDLLNVGAMFSEKGVKTKYKLASKVLMFPIWGNEGELISWQCRTFGKELDIPKWISKGNLQETMLIFFDGMVDIRSRTCQPNELVLVEDILSAIKVSLIGKRAMPLFGTNIRGRLHQLKLLDKVIIFLDNDMHQHSIKEAKNLDFYGINTRVILSDKDPKEYTFQELKGIL